MVIVSGIGLGRMTSSPEPLSPYGVEEQVLIKGDEICAASRALELEAVTDASSIRIRHVIGEIDLTASWHRTHGTGGEHIVRVPIVFHRL